MKDILWLIRKILRTTFRSKKNIVLYLLTPVVGIMIALFAYGSESSDITIGVVNHDGQQVALETISFLTGLTNLQIKEIDAGDVTEHIIDGKVDGVITLERGYSESVLAGKPDHVELTSIKGESVTGFVKTYLYQYIDNLTTLSEAAEGNPDMFNQMYHDFEQADFDLETTLLKDASINKIRTIFSFGFLIMIMMMSAVNLSEIILAEKENRTYFRLLSTPITARKYIFSNVIVNMIVMIMQVIMTLVLLTYVFQIDLNIPFWKAFVVMGIFSLISVGVSLVIVAFSNSRSAVSALTNVVVMPTVMLSGSFWPVEVMPESVQKIAAFLPQRWTLDTLEKLQEGSTFGSLYLNILILFAFAAALFLVATYKFSQNNNTQRFV